MPQNGQAQTVTERLPMAVFGRNAALP